jgi:PAS domain S-box-containing protein
MSVENDTYTKHTPAGFLELSSELNRVDSIEDGSAVAVRMLDLNFEAPLSAIWEYDDETDALHPVAESTEAEAVIGDAPVLPMDSLAGRAFEHDRPEVFADVREAAGTHNPETPIRSEILVPISDFGVLSVGATAVDAFTERDSEVVELVASNLEAVVSRVRRERAAQAEHDWAQTLFEGSNDAIFISDSGANLVQVNRAACELTGYDRGDLLSTSVPELAQDVDYSEYRDAYEWLLGSDPATSDATLVRSDDTAVEVNVSSRRIERDGEVYVHTAARDVTERRERRRQLESFKSAIENASDGIAILEDEEYTYVDRTHAEMYGFEDDEALLGRTWRDLYTDPAEVERIEDEVLSTLRSDGEWRGSVTASPPGKPEFPTELSLTRLADDRIVCVVRDVSGKHERRQERRENERRFESVFEDPGMLVGLLEPTGELIDVNETALEYVSSGKDEVLGDPFWEGEWWSHSQSQREALRDWIERAGDGEYVSFQADHRDQDGDTRFVTGTIRPVVGDSGVESLVVSSRDVTPRERGRQELETFQQAVEDAKDGFAILEDGEYVYIDETHVDMYGFDDTEELLGHSWRLLYDEAEADRLASEAFPVLESDGHWRGKVTGSRPDGSTFPAEISLTLLDDGPLVCTVRDETEKQERKQELELKEQAIDSSNVGVMITDAERSGNPIEYVNSGFTEITGYDEADALGRNPRFLHESDADPDRVARLRDAVAAGDPVTVELKNVRADGSEFWNRVSLTPVTDSDGAVSNFIGVQQDVTARRERVRNLTEQNRKLDLVLSGTGTGIIEWEPETDSLSFDETLVDHLGIDPRTTAAFLDAVAPADRDRVRASMNGYDDATDLSAEFRVIDASGVTRWIRTDAVSISDEQSDERFVAMATDRTEEVKRKRRIQQERERFEILSESLEEYAFVLLDDDGTIDSWNQGAADMFGYDTETATGMPVETLHAQPQRARSVGDRLLTQASLTGESTDQGQRVRSDGSSFPAEATYVPLQTDDEALGYGMVVRDLTERRQQRQRTERFVEESVEVVSVLDRDGDFTYVSQSAAQVLGYDPAELRGENLFDYLDVEDRSRVMEAFYAAAEEPDASVQLEFRARTAADEWITVEARGRNLFDDEAVGGFLLYVRDVSNIKAQTRKFESVFNQTFQLTGLLDRCGDILELNEPLLEYSGLQLDESTGTALWESDLFAHSADVQARIERAVEQAVAGKLVRFDVQAEGADGLDSFDFSIKPVSNQRGELSFLVFEARNITTQEQRRRHVQVLHRVMRHNIRNDLTKLRGYVDLLESETDTDASAEWVATIRATLERWEKMADKIRRIQTFLTDASDLVSHRSARKIIDSVRTAVETDGLDADVSVSTGQPAESRIPSFLDDAILELVENAVAANETGSPSVRVDASQPDPGWVEFSVSDDGPGLPEMERDLLETGEETPLSHGRGLGLWMVRSLVTQAGGSISVDTSGTGSEITLAVPDESARATPGLDEPRA